MLQKSITILFFLLLLAGCSAEQKDYHILEENYKLLKAENVLLKEENSLIKQENILLKQNLSSINGEFDARTDQVLDRLNNFQTTVARSISWFKRNSNIDDLSEYDEIKDLAMNCVTVNTSCQINLTCLYEVNRDYGFTYNYDQGDQLKDLDDIHTLGGGDCEDLSLLFKAEYNYLVDQCLEHVARKDVIPLASDQKINGNYMYILCGSFDPEGVEENFGGHCLMAVTKHPIEQISDIYQSLKEATLVEPQTGELVAEMSNTESITVFDNGMIPTTLHRVSLLITDDDLKTYYEYTDKIEWVGYQEFWAEAQDLRQELE